MRFTRMLVPLVLVVLLGAACGGGGDGGNGGNGGGPAVTSVSMVDNAFEPESFTVSAGTSLGVTNDGQALHSFTVTDLGIDEDVEPGASSQVTIDGDPATYDVTCKYHPEMTASMTVE